MDIDVIIETQDWQDVPLEPLVRRAVPVALQHLGLADRGLSLCVLGCDDARIASLNKAFRGKDAATNVLSWPSEERAAANPGGIPQAPDDPELGDMALSYDTCRAESDQSDMVFEDHVTHLIVHGLLHLLGYDHIDEADAELMEGTEVEILGKLGISNPY